MMDGATLGADLVLNLRRYPELQQLDYDKETEAGQVSQLLALTDKHSVHLYSKTTNRLDNSTRLFPM